VAQPNSFCFELGSRLPLCSMSTAQVGQRRCAALVHSRMFLKTKMCMFELQGVCSKGAQCPFAHDLSEMIPAPYLSRTKFCRTLRDTGMCNNPGCAFAHNKEELRTARFPGGLGKNSGSPKSGSTAAAPNARRVRQCGKVTKHQAFPPKAGKQQTAAAGHGYPADAYDSSVVGSQEPWLDGQHRCAPSPRARDSSEEHVRSCQVTWQELKDEDAVIGDHGHPRALANPGSNADDGTRFHLHKFITPGKHPWESAKVSAVGAVFQELLHCGEVSVKNTFLDFEPRTPTKGLRMVRSASGCLNEMESQDKS